MRKGSPRVVPYTCPAETGAEIRVELIHSVLIG